MKKTEGRKSRATVPLKTNFTNKQFCEHYFFQASEARNPFIIRLDNFILKRNTGTRAWILGEV
jgi:hypothetical protein